MWLCNWDKNFASKSELHHSSINPNTFPCSSLPFLLLYCDRWTSIYRLELRAALSFWVWIFENLLAWIGVKIINLNSQTFYLASCFITLSLMEYPSYVRTVALRPLQNTTPSFYSQSLSHWDQLLLCSITAQYLFKSTHMLFTWSVLGIWATRPNFPLLNRSMHWNKGRAWWNFSLISLPDPYFRCDICFGHLD